MQKKTHRKRTLVQIPLFSRFLWVLLPVHAGGVVIEAGGVIASDSLDEFQHLFFIAFLDARRGDRSVCQVWRNVEPVHFLPPV